MKLKVIVHTPVGVFESGVDDVAQENFEEFLSAALENPDLNYLTVYGEDGHTYVIREEILNNSVIEVIEL